MTESDFLAAIIANRSEDTPRLVYADWLEENGHPEHATFIRVQCELARIPLATIGVRSRRDDLMEMEQKLCSYRMSSWLIDLMFPDQRRKIYFGRGANGVNGGAHSSQASCVKWEFRRGFIETIECSWSGFISHHKTILASTPLEKVILTTWPFDTTNASFLRFTELWPTLKFELPARLLHAVR